MLDSAYRSYQLRMQAWTPRPGAGPIGMLLAVSINGGKPLKLVFDTGADGIYLSGKAAEGLELEYLAEAGARGPGNSRPVVTKKKLSATLRIDDLVLRNCIIDVTDKSLIADADGVIGARLFQQFVLNVDARRRLLTLTPYPEASANQSWADHDRPPEPPPGDWIEVSQIGHLLLVKTEFGDPSSGYLVLDSGAAYTCLSKSAAASGLNRDSFAMSAAGRGLVNAFRAGAVRLRIGNHDLLDRNVMTVDLQEMSNREGIEISGLIGYPLLSRSALTIDYRDGLIRVDPPK